MNNKIHLTFTYRNQLENLLDDIYDSYQVMNGKVFVLSAPDEGKLLCTYNVIKNKSHDVRLPHTILVHRKKQTNTLYTINALNELIQRLNNGVLDTKFAISWENYYNCLLLFNNNEFRNIKTKLHKIVNF